MSAVARPRTIWVHRFALSDLLHRHRLSADAGHLLMRLAVMAEEQKPHVYNESLSDLAEDTGMAQGTIRRALGQLAQKGLVAISGPLHLGASGVVEVLDVYDELVRPDWGAPDYDPLAPTKRTRLRRKPLAQALQRDVFARDGKCCRYCGFKHEDVTEFHIDHVIPVALGGVDAVANLVVACKRCNQVKGDAEWTPLPTDDAWRINEPLTTAAVLERQRNR